MAAVGWPGWWWLLGALSGMALAVGVGCGAGRRAQLPPGSPGSGRPQQLACMGSATAPDADDAGPVAGGADLCPYSSAVAGGDRLPAVHLRAGWRGAALDVGVLTALVAAGQHGGQHRRSGRCCSAVARRSGLYRGLCGDGAGRGPGLCLCAATDGRQPCVTPPCCCFRMVGGHDPGHPVFAGGAPGTRASARFPPPWAGCSSGRRWASSSARWWWPGWRGWLGGWHWTWAGDRRLRRWPAWRIGLTGAGNCRSLSGCRTAWERDRRRTEDTQRPAWPSAR